MNYYFVSMASLLTGKNLGNFILRALTPELCLIKAQKKGFMPFDGPLEIKIGELSEEDVHGEPMEIDVLYTPEEMKALGYFSSRERRIQAQYN